MPRSRREAALLIEMVRHIRCLLVTLIVLGLYSFLTAAEPHRFRHGGV